MKGKICSNWQITSKGGMRRKKEKRNFIAVGERLLFSSKSSRLSAWSGTWATILGGSMKGGKVIILEVMKTGKYGKRDREWMIHLMSHWNVAKDRHGLWLEGDHLSAVCFVTHFFKGMVRRSETSKALKSLGGGSASHGILFDFEVGSLFSHRSSSKNLFTLSYETTPQNFYLFLRTHSFSLPHSMGQASHRHVQFHL